MAQFPRWLTWVMLIGLAYILYVGNTQPNRTAPAPEPTPTTETAAPASQPQYKELHALLDRERWKRALNPDYAQVEDACSATKPVEGKLDSYAIVTREGSGEGAKCGDKIDLTLTRYGADGKAGKPITATLTLGEQKGLDALLLGITPGEARLLVVNLPSPVKNLPAHMQLLISAERAKLSP